MSWRARPQHHDHDLPRPPHRHRRPAPLPDKAWAPSRSPPASARSPRTAFTDTAAGTAVLTTLAVAALRPPCDVADAGSGTETHD
jgi:hypothetical protein